jgi:hypothetical protein
MPDLLPAEDFTKYFSPIENVKSQMPQKYLPKRMQISAIGKTICSGSPEKQVFFGKIGNSATFV